MKIAIIAAMSKELALLLPLIENCNEKDVNGYKFFTGRMGGHEVIAAQSGIGKVNAALAAQALIDSFHPEMVVNTGVAGGVGKTCVLDVVIPSEVAYHDVWCGPGTQWGEAAGCPRKLPCHVPAGVVGEIGARTGLLASGDIFISIPEEVGRILELYPDAIAVDMESAAIAQTCYLRNVPFACIRVISDTPGAADNIAQYENFWEDAPRATFYALKAFISKILHT